MNIDLPPSVTTPHDLATLCLEIESYAQWAHGQQIAATSGASTQATPPSLSDAAKQLIRTLGDSGSPDELHAALLKLRRQAPTISITLAAPAPISLRQTLTAWVRQHIDPNLLINFGFNRTILGGMVIRYNSAVYDWSFRRRIRDNQHLMQEVINRV